MRNHFSKKTIACAVVISLASCQQEESRNLKTSVSSELTATKQGLGTLNDSDVSKLAAQFGGPSSTIGSFIMMNPEGIRANAQGKGLLNRLFGDKTAYSPYEAAVALEAYRNANSSSSVALAAPIPNNGRCIPSTSVSTTGPDVNGVTCTITSTQNYITKDESKEQRCNPSIFDYTTHSGGCKIAGCNRKVVEVVGYEREEYNCVAHGVCFGVVGYQVKPGSPERCEGELTGPELSCEGILARDYNPNPKTVHDPNPFLGWGVGPTRDAAEREAMEKCNEEASVCTSEPRPPKPDAPSPFSAIYNCATCIIGELDVEIVCTGSDGKPVNPCPEGKPTSPTPPETPPTTGGGSGTTSGTGSTDCTPQQIRDMEPRCISQTL